MSVLESLKGIFAAKTIDSVSDDPKPERQLISADNYSDHGNAWKDPKMSFLDYRLLAYSVPLFYKATHKKNMDIYRGWPELHLQSPKKQVPVLDQKIFDGFNNRTCIQHKSYIAGVSAYMYGTGFNLITFIDDADDQDLSLPPNKHMDERLNRLVYSEPRQLTPMNSELISGAEYLNDFYRKQRVKHFTYETGPGQYIHIHPDRLYITKYDELPFSVLGISKTFILRNVLASLAEIDTSTGETLKWFSHGLVIWKKNIMKEPELKNMLKILNSHPNAYAIDETQDIKVENPAAIDPKPFYDFLCLEVASAFVMPVHILTGVEVGKTTGAEVGYGDYRKDISDVQYLKVNPSLVKLYTMLFESHGRDFDYTLLWPETYTDEMTEANISFKRAAIVERLWKSGTADRGERRDVMNEGHVYLDPDLESTDPVPVKQNEPKKEEVSESELIKQELRLEEARIMRDKKIKSFIEENK